MSNKSERSRPRRSCCGRGALSTDPTMTPTASFSVRSRRLSRRRPASKARCSTSKSRDCLRADTRAAAVCGDGRRLRHRSGASLASTLADEAQARAGRYADVSGRLRESLVWAGWPSRPGGVFESSAIGSKFGNELFYGRFAQTAPSASGSGRRLIHVDERPHARALSGQRVDDGTARRRQGLEVDR